MVKTIDQSTPSEVHVEIVRSCLFKVVPNLVQVFLECLPGAVVGEGAVVSATHLLCSGALVNLHVHRGLDQKVMRRQRYLWTGTHASDVGQPCLLASQEIYL